MGLASQITLHLNWLDWISHNFPLSLCKNDTCTSIPNQNMPNLLPQSTQPEPHVQASVLTFSPVTWTWLQKEGPMLLATPPLGFQEQNLRY